MLNARDNIRKKMMNNDETNMIRQLLEPPTQLISDRGGKAAAAKQTYNKRS
jgi:hypothetical protein